MNRSVYYFLLVLFVPALLTSCVSDDDGEPDIPEQIVIEAETTTLLIGDTIFVDGTYYNVSGQIVNIALNWVSLNTAVVTAKGGTVVAVGEGQAGVFAELVGARDSVIRSNTLQFTVEVNPKSLADLIIAADTTGVEVNETLEITFNALDGNGDPYQGQSFQWASSDPSIASVDSSGVVTGRLPGVTTITLTVDGVVSNELDITVSGSLKFGTFRYISYEAAGTAYLFVDESDSLILELGSDFDAEVAVETYLYLSNDSTSGKNVLKDGLEVASIQDTPKGARAYNISRIDASVGLETYANVVILCVPYEISMAFAPLK